MHASNLCSPWYMITNFCYFALISNLAIILKLHILYIEPADPSIYGSQRGS